MGSEREKPFQSELHGRVKEYLNKYEGARGVRLKVKELGEVTIDRKEPDIVITDERDVPVLIVETKRKGLRPSEKIDPLDKGPIAQALCYAYLLKEKYGRKSTVSYRTSLPRTAMPYTYSMPASYLAYR
jgi:hypothetical protein